MIEVRALSSHEQMQEAVRLQKEIWGFEEAELVPARLFVVAASIGGQVLGAFDGEQMVGFCLAYLGRKPEGEVFLHSQMLGVVPGYRDQGVGRWIKLAQREDALSRSIQLIEWTFDPLEIKNAYFNIERLGAIVRRHLLHRYGYTSSPLHGGLPTDRCVAEWHLASPRVRAVLDGRPAARPEIAQRVEVPASIDRLRREEPERARRIQAELGERFRTAFGAGLAVVGLERREEAGVYLLGRWESE